jgi:hypothetical protein
MSELPFIHLPDRYTLIYSGLETGNSFSEKSPPFFEKVATLFEKTRHTFPISVAGSIFRKVNGC